MFILEKLGVVGWMFVINDKKWQAGDVFQV